MAHAAGCDFAIQATGGLMSVTGEKEGTPGSQRQKVDVTMAHRRLRHHRHAGRAAGVRLERGRNG